MDVPVCRECGQPLQETLAVDAQVNLGGKWFDCVQADCSEYVRPENVGSPFAFDASGLSSPEELVHQFMARGKYVDEPKDTLHKFDYGTICHSCGRFSQAGVALLKKDATLEDLRDEVESKRGLGGNQVCSNVHNERPCEATNHVTRGDVVFRDGHI